MPEVLPVQYPAADQQAGLILSVQHVLGIPSAKAPALPLTEQEAEITIIPALLRALDHEITTDILFILIEPVILNLPKKNVIAIM